MALGRLLAAAACLLALVFAVAFPACAQTELLPGYPATEAAPRGPAEAKGAVLWSHGVDRVAEAEPFIPFAIDYLRDAGYDVFLLKRRWAGEGVKESSVALVRAIDDLKGRGYRRIVLAGQSFGAWISFVAGAVRSDVDAVVAFAPAAFGPAKPGATPQPNADLLYPVVEKLRGGRVMVFLFDRDPFDPGGRGEAIGRILKARGLPHVIVDRPEGLVGHGMGLTSGFAHRFGPCIAAFIAATEVAPGFSCDQVPAAGKVDFTLPQGLRVVPPPANAATGLAAFSGRWFGHYNNGREILLVVQEMGVDRVLAVYAWARNTPIPKDRNGYERRRGEYDPATGVLSFTEPGKQRLRFRLRPDGRMEGSWTAPEGKYTLNALLRLVGRE